MGETNDRPPGLGSLLQKLARTGLGALQNRGELLAVEWQQERKRLTELLVWAIGLAFLGMMGTLMLTMTILLLVPEGARVYVAAGFSLLYVAGTVWAWRTIQSLLKEEPFADSIDQVKKDAACLESLG